MPVNDPQEKDMLSEPLRRMVAEVDAAVESGLSENEAVHWVAGRWQTSPDAVGFVVLVERCNGDMDEVARRIAEAQKEGA